MNKISFYFALLRVHNLGQAIKLANKTIYNGDLEKIIEVTYSYKDLGDGYILNETLFQDFISYGEEDLYISKRLDLCKKKLLRFISLISSLESHCSHIRVKGRTEGVQRGIFIESLQYVKNILHLAYVGSDFEAEKAGYILPYGITEIKKRVKKLELYEKEAFGGKIISSPKEFSQCYNFVLQNHQEKKSKLSQSDQRIMKKVLNQIYESGKMQDLQPRKYTEKKLRHAFLKKEIHRKDYRKIFDLVCEMYGLPQRTKITNAGSIYDGDNFLEIPKNDAHEYFTLERLLKLLTHEIESHYINAYNSRLLLGNFRGAKNLPKEEGLAKFMEKIFQGENYDTIHNIVDFFFTTMSGESLVGEDLDNFMRIMGKEYKCKQDYITTIIRAKRNYPFHLKGVQHKDVVYFRGLEEVVNYLKSGGEFYRLFLGKVGMHDLENITDIYHTSHERQDVVFPLFISDLIYYYLTHKINSEDFIFSTPKYYLYLKKKYWFLDIESFSVIDHVNRDWKKIQRIIRLFEKTIL